MSIDFRTYGGRLFRPTPMVSEMGHLGLVAISTLWGEKVDLDLSAIITEAFVEESDQDRTIIRGQTKVTHYKSDLERMFMAFSLTHQALQDRFNEKQFTVGLGLTLLKMRKNSLLWMSLGGPSVFSFGSGRPVSLLKNETDLSFQWKQSSPLPQHLLGIDDEVHPFYGELLSSSFDELLLLERSHIPSQIFLLMSSDLDEVSRVCAQDDVDQPYWAAIIQKPTLSQK